jgi:hypothetical protein
MIRPPVAGIPPADIVFDPSRNCDWLFSNPPAADYNRNA